MQFLHSSSMLTVSLLLLLLLLLLLPIHGVLSLSHSLPPTPDEVFHFTEGNNTAALTLLGKHTNEPRLLVGVTTNTEGLLYVLDSNLQVLRRIELPDATGCKFQFEAAGPDNVLLLCGHFVYNIGEEAGQVHLLDVALLPPTTPDTGFLFIGATVKHGWVVGGVLNTTGRYFRLYRIDFDPMMVVSTPALDNIPGRIIFTDQGEISPDGSYLIIPYFKMETDAPSDPGLLKIDTTTFTKGFTKGQINPAIIFPDGTSGLAISNSQDGSVALEVSLFNYEDMLPSNPTLKLYNTSYYTDPSLPFAMTKTSLFLFSAAYFNEVMEFVYLQVNCSVSKFFSFLHQLDITQTLNSGKAPIYVGYTPSNLTTMDNVNMLAATEQYLFAVYSSKPATIARFPLQGQT